MNEKGRIHGVELILCVVIGLIAVNSMGIIDFQSMLTVTPEAAIPELSSKSMAISEPISEESSFPWIPLGVGIGIIIVIIVYVINALANAPSESEENEDESEEPDEESEEQQYQKDRFQPSLDRKPFWYLNHSVEKDKSNDLSYLKGGK